MNLALCLPIPQLGFSRGTAPHRRHAFCSEGGPSHGAAAAGQPGGQAGDRYHPVLGRCGLCGVWHKGDVFFWKQFWLGSRLGGTWVWPTASAIFLQLEPRYRPWAYSGGLFQEPGDGGCDEDAGGPGNVLIGRLGL